MNRVWLQLGGNSLTQDAASNAGHVDDSEPTPKSTAVLFLCVAVLFFCKPRSTGKMRHVFLIAADGRAFTVQLTQLFRGSPHLRAAN